MVGYFVLEELGWKECPRCQESREIARVGMEREKFGYAKMAQVVRAVLLSADEAFESR
jgi:hypothetical protein